MKTTRHIFIIGLLLTIFSCGQSSKNQVNNHKVNQDKNENFKTFINQSEKKIDYIIFGRFCAECGGECATMYKFDILTNKLFADHTDSFWEYRRGTPMKFATIINNKNKESLIRQFLDSIPNYILTATKPIQNFGCPDCTDGCGIYLETKSDKKIKKFVIDYQTEQLSGEIKIFANDLIKIIDKLEK